MVALAPLRGVWLVAAALLLSLLLALGAYVVGRFLLHAELSLPRTLVTAVVVGSFLSLFLARPAQKRTHFTVEGASVEGKEGEEGDEEEPR